MFCLMTHYYLYIAAGLTIDSNTRFYKVGIGESETQNKKRAWLEAYAFEHGHFFVRWSHEAMDFLVRCHQSIGRQYPDVRSVMANDLCKILNGTGEEPAHYQAELNRHHLLMQIDPNYYTCQVLKTKKGELE